MAQVMASRVTTLAVAYSDANTVRSRLVGVAQCVRELCSAAGHSAQLPQLALPRIARFGFWHMGFRSEDDFAAAIETLHGRELGPTAGCPAGRLVLEREEQPFDGIAATACCSLSSLSADHLSETEALLARRFGASGGLLAVYVPRLPSGWDPGVAALTFADGESAEAARLLLDGAPSHVAGDELTALRHAPRAGAGEGLSEAGAREIEALRLLRCEEHEI
mmetsp:Transcript_15167/g.48802  ORF Transcript_15167/g.48802 Transcript_15167/m.48802 type:complete len:221 (+) Transcript_15167:112-774(+)